MSSFPNDPFLVYKRKGDKTDPFLQYNEPKQVYGGKVVLTEIPDKGNHVTVKDSNNISYAEVYSQASLSANNVYYVDYERGIVYFDASKEGLTFTFSYLGIGGSYIPATRVYTQSSNGTITQDVQDMIDNYNQLNGTDLYNLFDPQTGHKHTGGAGDAPAIDSQYVTYNNGQGTVSKVKDTLDSHATQLANIPNQTYITEKAKQTDLDITNQSKADKSYVDTQIHSVASGSPKGIYATVSALQTAFPTGNTNIYLVTADGKWYYWSGTAWTAGGVYQSTGATNNFYQIALEGYLSRNLFNKLTQSAGRLDANGNVNATVTGYFTTDFIPVTAGSSYISNYASGFIYTYDSTKTKITSTLTNITSSSSFIIPSGVSYIRASFTSSNLDTLQIEAGTSTTSYDGVGGYQIPQDRIKQLTTTLSTNAATAKSYTDQNASYKVSFTTNTIPTFTLSGTGSSATLTVAFPANGVMYAINNLSTNIMSFSFASQSFTLNSGDILYWDFNTNTVTKTKPTYGITLVVFTNGIFKTGGLFEIYSYQLNQSTNSSIVQLQSDVKDSVPQTSESRGSVVSGFAADQGMDVVKEEIWVFRSSNSDHTGAANIEIYDKNTFVHKGIMTHNFGHAATVSYSALWDNLLIANGDSDNTVLPRLDFLPAASSYGVGSSLDFNIVNKISIEFFVKDGSGNVTKQIGGSGLVACFGESPYIVYMIPYTGPSSRTIYKVLLGTGTNDYSDSTGTDTSKWGTFISGKGTNDLNGTAKVIETYTCAQYGTSQGLKYHEGKLFYGVTQSPYQCKILELVNLENGKFKCLKSYKYPPVNPDNTYTYEETEDVAILDGRYLISGMRTSSVENLVLFPLYNEQGGKGSTGNRIALPFTCKTVPQIKITPTSNVTDLYVSNVDTSGFTVLSASGGSGTFNWECKIS